MRFLVFFLLKAEEFPPFSFVLSECICFAWHFLRKLWNRRRISYFEFQRLVSLFLSLFLFLRFSHWLNGSPTGLQKYSIKRIFWHLWFLYEISLRISSWFVVSLAAYVSSAYIAKLQQSTSKIQSKGKRKKNSPRDRENKKRLQITLKFNLRPLFLTFAIHRVPCKHQI